MTLTEAQVADEAALLDDAERAGTQIRQTTSVHPDMTLDDAYRVQKAWLERRLGRGEVLVGHKIGLTSRAMQAAMKITTPDSGFITDAMVFDPDSTLVAADFCDPKVELELCFVLARDLTGADPTIEDVLDATDHVTPAVELIAARSFRIDPTTGRARTVVDTVADNAADGGLICGGHRVGPRDRRPALGGSAGLPQRRHRGNGCCRRCARPPGARDRLAGPPLSRAGASARGRPVDPGRVLHPPDRCPGR